MTVSIQATRADVRAVMSRLVRALSGLEADSSGVVRRLQMRMGVTLLSKVQQAFIEKSRGGTGDDGITWKPLKRATIAARRTSRAELKSLGIKGGKKVRGLLTPSQDKLWRRVYATQLSRLSLRGAPDASGIAARMAWAAVKAIGARTRLEALGSRKVDILRDTSRLFVSLTPGVDDRPANQPEQVFRVPAGKVIVGTKVPYAGRQHATRPLWPKSLPRPWWAAINGSLRRGLGMVVVEYLRGNLR